MDSQECLFNMNDNASVVFSEHNSLENDESEYNYKVHGNNDYYTSNIKQEISEVPQVDEDLLQNNKLNHDYPLKCDILNTHLNEDDEIQQFLGIKEETQYDYRNRSIEEY